MKRFAVLTLVLIMVFALAVAPAAKDSPTGKEYYKINTSAEGDGTVVSDPIKVEKDTDGTATLTASDGSGYFTRWIISGDYEIVSGSISDPVITIRPSSDIDVIGSFSADKDYLTMTAFSNDESLGTASVDISKVRKGDEDTVVTFTADDTSGTFIEWVFECDYKLVSGDTKSKVVKLIPYTDVKGTAYFKKAPAPDKKDDSDTSPKTGDPMPYAVTMIVMALGAAVVAVKKLKEQ